MKGIAVKANEAAAGVAISRWTCGLALAAMLSVSLSLPAGAQIAMPGAPLGAGSIATGGRSHGAAPRQAPIPAPDAVPGARSREPAAPATRPAGDMQPTDALFDAINRGDMTAARDALSRGADLNGVNILGMTPLELSVDLARNDISFLLLSMRGEDGGRRPVAPGGDTAAFAPAGKTTQAGKPAAGPGISHATARRRGRAPARGTSHGTTRPRVVATPAEAPKLFANDGGTPLPSAGFLGFGSSSSAN